MIRAGASSWLARMLIGGLGMLVVAAASAGSLPAPSGKPILTISGKIGSTNKGDTAQFDREMLEVLGMVPIRTATPWHEDVVEFEGVPLDRLMEHVGATGQNVTAIALNDYTTEIPIEDFVEHGPILALKKNGEYMPISDRGPLFIIYPFDSDPELKSQTYYGRSAWQVFKMVVN